MNSDLLSSLVYLLSAAPSSPSHDHLDVTIYQNGLADSSLRSTSVLPDATVSNAYVYPRLFVAIRSVLVHAAIRWPSMIPAHQIVDSLPEALFLIRGSQVAFCRSELALLISGDTAEDIISHCHNHNTKIPWDAIMSLDAQTRPIPNFKNALMDPLEQFINLEEFPMQEIAPTYEQPNDLVNDYDGPLFDDWHSFVRPTGCEPNSTIPAAGPCAETSVYLLPSGIYPVDYSTLDCQPNEISVNVGEPSFQPLAGYSGNVVVDSYEETSDYPSPSSTRSSPFPETPAFENFRTDLPDIACPMSTVAPDAVVQEEQQAVKVAQIIQTAYSPLLAPFSALSSLSDCESPPSRSPSASPSFESSQRGSASPTPSDEYFQAPAPTRAPGKKARRSRAGAIRKKKTKSKEKHFCCYCSESFTRDHDAERHQRTCKANPNCSQKEQCKVCAKPLPVRLDARRRHWGTLECSDAARKRGLTRMDEETYEII